MTATASTSRPFTSILRHFALGGGLLFALVCLFPGQAAAKKCPKGQYGVFKCIKCPAGTYAYKDHILTKLGCKKCASGTYSKAGWRSCKDKGCAFKAGSKTLALSSGLKVCNIKDGFLYKCYRGKMSKQKRECTKKACSGTKAGKAVSYAHGKKQCNKADWQLYECKYGTWVKQSACPKAACIEWKGKVKFPHAHGKVVCQNKVKYKCRSTHWVKVGTCN